MNIFMQSRSGKQSTPAGYATYERNTNARSFYKKLGYHERGILPCLFNGIPDVKLVMLEKKLS